MSVCWLLGLATGCILSAIVRTAQLIPLTGSFGIFFGFLQMDLIWRYFKAPFKLLNLDIIVTT